MNILAEINANNTFLLDMPETIRRLRENQEQLRKQQESWKKDYEEKEIQRTHEMKREFELLHQQIQNSIIDKRQIEQLIQTSVTIKDLRESISRMRQLYDTIPEGFTQAALKAPFTANETETIERKRPIEQLASNVDNHGKKLNNRLNNMSTKPMTPAKTISREEVEKLILETIRNLKLTEQNDNSELRKLIQDMNDRLGKLEKQFNQLSQSNSINNIRNSSKEPDDQTTIKSQPYSQKESLGKPVHHEQQPKSEPELPSNSSTQVHDILSIEQRLTQIEDRLNASRYNEAKLNDSIRNVPLVGNATQTQSMVPTSNPQHPGSAQKLNVNKETFPTETSKQTSVSQSNNGIKKTLRDQKTIFTNGIDRGLHDDHVPNLQNNINDYSVTIQNLQNQIDNLSKTKPDRQAVDDLIKSGEQRNGQKINDLQKHVNKYEDDLNKFNADLAALRRQLTQKPTSTAVPSTSKIPPTKIDNEEQFQAIMPFIEPLPIFAMLIENEWG
ncbi:unnamed protein product [Rotaria sp. Silwood1]|nr:unnamed protein product [Rotaria sp. Silwood1]